MQNFTELAKQRRSIRRYTEQELTQEQVVDLMKAALLAPSSKSTRPWDFILVDDKKLLHQLSECKTAGAKFLENAPLGIIVSVNTTSSDVWIEDASVASTMLLLQAEDLGLGACWIQIRNRHFEDGTPASDIIREIIGIPASHEIVSIIAIGNKATSRNPVDESKLLWEKIHFNHFGQK